MKLALDDGADDHIALSTEIRVTRRRSGSPGRLMKSSESLSIFSPRDVAVHDEIAVLRDGERSTLRLARPARTLKTSGTIKFKDAFIAEDSEEG